MTARQLEQHAITLSLRHPQDAAATRAAVAAACRAWRRERDPWRARLLPQHLHYLGTYPLTARGLTDEASDNKHAAFICRYRRRHPDAFPTAWARARARIHGGTP